MAKDESMKQSLEQTVTAKQQFAALEEKWSEQVKANQMLIAAKKQVEEDLAQQTRGRESAERTIRQKEVESARQLAEAQEHFDQQNAQNEERFRESQRLREEDIAQLTQV